MTYNKITLKHKLNVFYSSFFDMESEVYSTELAVPDLLKLAKGRNIFP
jgi:hypothetical protein